MTTLNSENINKGNMSSPSTLLRCLQIAWPVSLQSVLAAALGMIDIIMVSHLGESAVAGIGLASRIQFVLLMVGGAFSVTAGIVVAQYIGAQKAHAVSSIIAQILIVAVGLMLPLILLCNIFGVALIELGSDDMDVITISSSYLTITLPSLLVLLVYQVFEGALRGLAQVLVPMMLGAVAMLINVLLNYLLINGVTLGDSTLITAMGTDGAAWATSLSRGILLFLLLAWLVQQKHLCLPRNKTIKLKNPECDWSSIIKISLPVAINFAVWSLGTFVYQIIFGSLGTQALAIMSMLAPIEGTLISLFIGFSTACSVLTGQKLGNNQMDSAYRLGRNLTYIITGIALLTGGLVWLFQELLLAPFASYEQHTLELAAQILLIMCLGIAIKTANMTMSLGVLRSGADNRFCLMTDTLGMWMVGIPLTWYLAGSTGTLLWVFIATYSEEVTKYLLFAWRMHSKKWLRNITQKPADIPCAEAQMP
ncbi:MATE family efflux transporter [Planctobacterium marinum]|uniref:Multidrug-efflux transporter n=1 Tax=Planctobacterium marinum TaxID=1631968 RepID=A0AA48KQH0_9ALTE|nr:MATE family efflux transporter [Planctobacterium marinum]